MELIPNIIFTILLIFSLGIFIRNIKRLKRNINLGKGETEPITNKTQRLKNMIRIALGQSKMMTRPIPAILHIIVYVGFIVINIELIEIIIDGITGTHRVFKSIGNLYGVLISLLEVFAVLVLVSVIIFWVRRNVLRLKRFYENKMIGWPKLDADLILYFEIILMSLFLLMNATDIEFQNMNNGNIISRMIHPLFSEISLDTLHILERTFWWLHITGILIFLNYLYYSKHLHIILAFPNTFYGSLSNQGRLNNMSNVTNEVNIMLGKTNDSSEVSEDLRFGASDITDLSWLQLLNAYSCTECGRCTSSCPANITGKKLSPRKIMMDTRDRIEEVGRIIDKNGEYIDDGKKLLGDYVTKEELWACTSCNACVEECPISINPLSIIMDMRRNLIMEESSAPNELNNMMNNIENNGAPWPYNQLDRLNWKE